MRWKNQLVIAAENFGREKNVSFALILTMVKDMEEQLQLAHKAVDVVNRGKERFV